MTDLNVRVNGTYKTWKSLGGVSVEDASGSWHVLLIQKKLEHGIRT